MNVAAVLAADVAADRKVTLYPLGNDIQSTSAADARVVYGSAGASQFRIISGPYEGRVTNTSGNGNHNARDFTLTYRAHPWASGLDQMMYQNRNGCQAIITFNVPDRPPQPAFTARNRFGEADRMADRRTTRLA